MNVAILGASQNPDRYAYLAFKMLQQYGHTPFPVTPKFGELEEVKAFARLGDLPAKMDTLTMYVNRETSSKIAEEILALKPRRVIFNPGSENPELQSRLENAGIQIEEACTLVLLRTNQF